MKMHKAVHPCNRLMVTFTLKGLSTYNPIVIPTVVSVSVKDKGVEEDAHLQTTSSDHINSARCSSSGMTLLLR